MSQTLFELEVFKTETKRFLMFPALSDRLVVAFDSMVIKDYALGGMAVPVPLQLTIIKRLPVFCV
ncbi:hypothetical protein [Calothrix parietina]|uniref:hypothetical protein n=1 Tax=Calothrix parietina TaxID=32054 RepID=UPI0016842CC9|nr:hypothetical protein [Calothrix parietina]